MTVPENSGIALQGLAVKPQVVAPSNLILQQAPRSKAYVDMAARTRKRHFHKRASSILRFCHANKNACLNAVNCVSFFQS